MATNIEDSWSEGCNPLPRQHLHKLSDRSTTLRTDAKFQRMRSCSVTLGGRNKAANSATRARQMERSYSIGVMASSSAEKLTTSRRCEDDVRPRSWMRASMRLVRPFHLADPPSPSGQRPDEPVQIHLPPVFPCDVERPCSAPMPERPRQYGRSGQRRLSSRLSSASESAGSSFSGENWDNTDSGPADSVSRTESERSPGMTRNESVSSTATQSTTRTAPAPSTG